ncbi:MAG: hypothetical protein RLY47_53 [Candidatus Parcubacteria bacterium]
MVQEILAVVFRYSKVDVKKPQSESGASRYTHIGRAFGSVAEVRELLAEREPIGSTAEEAGPAQTGCALRIFPPRTAGPPVVIEPTFDRCYHEHRFHHEFAMKIAMKIGVLLGHPEDPTRVVGRELELRGPRESVDPTPTTVRVVEKDVLLLFDHTSTGR